MWPKQLSWVGNDSILSVWGWNCSPSGRQDISYDRTEHAHCTIRVTILDFSSHCWILINYLRADAPWWWMHGKYSWRHEAQSAVTAVHIRLNPDACTRWMLSHTWDPLVRVWADNLPLHVSFYQFIYVLFSAAPRLSGSSCSAAIPSEFSTFSHFRIHNCMQSRSSVIPCKLLGSARLVLYILKNSISPEKCVAMCRGSCGPPQCSLREAMVQLKTVCLQFHDRWCKFERYPPNAMWFSKTIARWIFTALRGAQ